MPERQHLQRRMMDGLLQLTRLLETARDYRSAIEYAQRLLQCEPFDESTYCTLMRLHAANGDRAGALRIYQRCVDLLQEEFAAAPASTTQELYQRLLTTELAPPSHPGTNSSRAIAHDQLPLVGRTGEWQTMIDAWYRASSGKPHCLLLTGEAGIGKTRLAEELLAWVAHQGFPTAAAHCYAAEGSLTYTPVIAWLRSPAIHQSLGGFDRLWRNELVRLLPELVIEPPHLPQPTPITQGWQHQRFFEALARAVLRQNKPLLMLLDDLQRANRDTLEWLHYLLRFDPKAKLLLLATVRREEAVQSIHYSIRSRFARSYPWCAEPKILAHRDNNRHDRTVDVCQINTQIHKEKDHVNNRKQGLHSTLLGSPQRQSKAGSGGQSICCRKDEALKQHIADAEAAFPHYELTTEDLIAEDNTVVLRFALRATHQGNSMGIPATGREINVPGIIIYRIASDKSNAAKLVKHWMQIDSAAMMQQLGVQT